MTFYDFITFDVDFVGRADLKPMQPMQLH